MTSAHQVDRRTAPRIALIDANVFFAPRLRDLVVHLHMTEVINVHWTRRIEDEWTKNVVAKGGANPDAIQRCLLGMRQAVNGWEVVDYQQYIGSFQSIQEKDRHVAAAAHKLALEDWPGNTVALITSNIKDFPTKAFRGLPLRRLAPGPYIDQLFREEPAAVLAVIDTCRQKLKQPPADQERYVQILMHHQCKGLAHALSKIWRVDCPRVARNGSLFYPPAEDIKTAA